MNCSLIGELIKDSGPCRVTWQIANFFSLPAEVNTFYLSPHFYFLNLRWYLKIYPNGHTNHDSEGWTDLYLIRSDSGLPRSVRYVFGIRENDGKVNDTIYSNESRIFSEECLGRGPKNFLRRSELLSRKSQGALSDALTVVCTMWSDEPLIAEGERLVSRESQTEDLADDSTSEEGGLRLDTKGVVILQKHFQDLLLDSKDHDVILKVKDQHFRAHKNILRARSPVFAAMLAHTVAENECGEVRIEDCDPRVFGEFLKYVYVGKFGNMSPTTAVVLYYIADKYDFPDLKERCVKFLKASLTTNAISHVVTLAMKHGADELLEYAMEFFSEHMMETLMTVEWQRFITNYPILSNELTIKAMKISRKNTE